MRQEWTGSPEAVLAAWALPSREDLADEKQRSQRVAAARERAQDIVDAFRWEGVPIPSIGAQIVDTLQRGGLTARDADIDREAERVRAQRQMDRDAEVGALMLAGRMPRTPQETFALVDASWAVQDAEEERAKRAMREQRGAPAGGWTGERTVPSTSAPASRAATVDDDGVIERARARVARYQARAQAQDSHVSVRADKPYWL